MNLRITAQKEEPLLSRKEITAEMDYEKATPSKDELKKQLVASLKANEKLLVIKKITQEFGSKEAKVVAYIYDNEKDMKLVEPKKKAKKGDGKKRGVKEDKGEEEA